MKGPYNLAENQIKINVLVQSGAYILVNIHNKAIYVGRSDSDLNHRLQEHLSNNESNICIKRSGACAFYFENIQSSKEAYILECNWYHQYSPTCNIAHPAKSSLNYSCPICGL